MNIENRLITNEDVELIKKYRDEKGLVDCLLYTSDAADE